VKEIDERPNTGLRTRGEMPETLDWIEIAPQTATGTNINVIGGDHRAQISKARMIRKHSDIHYITRYDGTTATGEISRNIQRTDRDRVYSNPPSARNRGETTIEGPTANPVKSRQSRQFSSFRSPRRFQRKKRRRPG
jgi:hypothetical protein